MKPAQLTAALASAFGIAACLSVIVGETSIVALARRDSDLAWLLVSELRLPRLILAAAAGAVLGLAGAALQGLLRNPLASPDILGTSSGAALGAVVVAYYIGVGSSIAMAAGGIIGALAALLLLLLLAGRGASSPVLILAGIALSAIGGAFMNLALTLAPSPFAFYDIMFWLLGSFADRSWAHVAAGVPVMLVGGILLASTRRALDRLSLGEDVAETLGVDVAVIRRRIIAGSAVAVGGSVAIAGIVGFIGLIVPHLVRPLVGQRPGAALLPSAAAGAALLVAADVATRIPVAGTTLPVGVVTALLGAPFFQWLILARRREAVA